MMTRREMLQATGAGASLIAAGIGAARGAAPTVRTPVAFDVPRGACDCHVHIFDPAGFSYAPERVYTPPPALVDGLRELQTALRLERVVIVTPSVYGPDNSSTLYGIHLDESGSSHLVSVRLEDIRKPATRAAKAQAG